MLSMFPPSGPLKMPKISEKMEININSPKTIQRGFDIGTPSASTAMGLRGDDSTADQGTLSSTASSLSHGLDTAEAETEMPRSITPESSVE